MSPKATRPGEGRPKALLPWGGQTLVEYQVSELAAAGCETIVVILGHDADRILPYVTHPNAEVVMNPRYGEGRASSLRAGVQAVPRETRTLVILNVDQPRPREVIARLLAEHSRSGAPVTVPEYGGHRGHPVVVNAELLPELRQVTDETLGLRAVLERHAARTLRVAFADPIVRLDINTPEDEASARRIFEPGGRSSP